MEYLLKITLVCFVLFAQSYTAYGQEIEEPIFSHESGKSLSWVLGKKFSTEARKQHLFNNCMTAVTFVKFTLNAEGKIDTMNFTKGSPSNINAVLESVLRSTDGHWIPKKVNGKTVKSKPFILPFVYSFESGCTSSYLDRYNKAVGTLIQSLGNMLQFDDGSTTEDLSCILLSPIRSSSVN